MSMNMTVSEDSAVCLEGGWGGVGRGGEGWGGVGGVGRGVRE